MEKTKDWKDLFTPVILDRGKDYYERGCIEEFERTSMGYEATVKGSDLYNVEIFMQDEEVVSMDCDCPYADKGNNCKHMAAVMYAIDEVAKLRDEVTGNLSDQMNLFEILNKLSKEELQNIILKFANDKAMKNYIFLRFAKRIDHKYIEALKMQFDTIVENYLNNKVNIQSDFIEDVYNFVEENMSLLFNRKAYIEAFDLSQDIFLKLGNVQINYVKNQQQTIYDLCRKYWCMILDKCKHKEREIIFTWLMEQLCKQDPDKYLEYTPKLIFDMLTMEFDDEEHQDEYWVFPLIRKLAVHELIQHGKQKEAVEILKNSKKLDEDNLALVAEYSRQLMKIYLSTGEIVKYKQEALFYARHCYKQVPNYDIFNQKE